MELKENRIRKECQEEVPKAGQHPPEVLVIIIIIIIIINPWLMEPIGSMLHSQGSPIIPILSRINPIPRIDTYLFKIILILSFS